MLEQLSNLDGISGREDSVRSYLLECLKEAPLETSVDTMGNLLVRKGKTVQKPLMISAHMDEVGLMITSIDKKGMLNFNPVGGIDSRVLPGTRVRFGDACKPGVIGVKPIHLQKAEEQEKPFDPETLYIDGGFSSEAEACRHAKVGDYAAFDIDCISFGADCYRGKAFDDRAGCLILLKLLLEDNGLNFSAAFTVQEEVGTRGAIIAANHLKPRFALVVETTAAADTPDNENKQAGTVLGDGPAISIMDRTLMVSRRMREGLVALAEKRALPYHYRRFTGAGTEGGAIALSGEGVQTAVVSVPCRYIHSPNSVISRRDIDNTMSLVRAWLEKHQ